jgi:hypothetical protein
MHIHVRRVGSDQTRQVLLDPSPGRMTEQDAKQLLAFGHDRPYVLGATSIALHLLGHIKALAHDHNHANMPNRVTTPFCGKRTPKAQGGLDPLTLKSRCVHCKG